MAQYGGWTGKILRVNLTTGAISSEDTIAKGYKDFVGAEGFGMKVMWDEVPAGTHPYSPANKLIMGAGPFSGTGIPLAGRVNYTSLLPDSPFFGVGSGHGSGHWSSNLKFACWDSVIVEGRAKDPGMDPHRQRQCVDQRRPGTVGNWHLSNKRSDYGRDGIRARERRRYRASR